MEKTFKVYHFTDDRGFFGYYDEITTFNADDYERVAILKCNNLEDVFRDTNHIDDHWWNNENIEWYKESRSTSCVPCRRTATSEPR